MFGDPVRNEKGWDVAPLEDLIDPARPITYGILKPGPDTPGGVPYVRVVDMANGTVKRTGVKRTTRAIAEAYRRSVLRAGDLLLSIRGHVGRIALVPDELEAANITQDTARLALLPGHSTAYVAASLTSSPMQSHMRRYVKGVAVTGINLGDVKKLPVPTPPLELQQRFTSVALRHSRMSARAREAQETTRRLFDSLAQRAFREHSE
jgi:type I restriction enzyme S subunit